MSRPIIGAMACLPSYLSASTASRATPSTAATAQTDVIDEEWSAHRGHGVQPEGDLHTPHRASLNHEIVVQHRVQIHRPTRRHSTHSGGKIKSRHRSNRLGTGY